MKLTQLTNNQVVHCKTQEEATRICNMAHELGWKWLNGKSYKETYWYGYKEEMCYAFDERVYGNVSFCRTEGKEIINSTKIENMKNPADKKQITYPVEAKDMQQVFDIACPSWKKKLAKEFATQMMLGEVCNVTEELKKEMLSAATSEQIELVKSLFEEDLSVDVNSMKLGCFFAPRTEGEYKGKGFALYNGYDWNIVRDNKDQIVLVPTKIPANKKGVKKLLNSIECPLK